MKWNKSNNYAHLQTYFLSHPARQVIGVQSYLAPTVGPFTGKGDKKIAQTVEQVSEPEAIATGFLILTKISKTAEQICKYGLRRLCRSIFGKAPLFRNIPKNFRGYAARPEAVPHEPLKSQAVKQSFTVNRTAKPFRSVKTCPTKISKTAEQACKILGPVILVLSFLVTPAFAQEKPKAILIDEFSKGLCEDVGARLDHFVPQLQGNPGSSGLMLIYPKVDEPRDALQIEDRINRYFAFRKYGDEYRPKIIYGKPSDETKFQFWLIPQGGNEPEYIAAKPGEMFEKVNKPFLYNTEFGGEECPGVNPSLMARIVAFNRNVDLRIIVRERSARQRNRKMNEWLDRLVTREKIPREWIRVILSSKLERDYYPREDVEFWMVPTKIY